MKAGWGLRQANFGDCTGAKNTVRESLTELPNGQNRLFAAYALAECGEEAASQKLIEDLGKEMPENSLIHGQQIPVVTAINRVHRGKATEALEVLEKTRPYESGVNLGDPVCWPMYVRGVAYLSIKDGDKAIGEFKKILDFPGRAGLSDLMPMAQLGIARSYAQKADATKARTAYQDFLARWKDADADLPVLMQAKAEYGKLQ